MAKRVVFCLVLVMLVASGVFAQERAPNYIYGQVTLLGAGFGYERLLAPFVGIGGEAYFNSFFIFWNTAVAEAFVKFYPTPKGVFNIKLGFGWGYGTALTGTRSWSSLNFSWYNGFVVDPGLGWKIDFEGPGGFFIEPKFSVPLSFGYVGGYGVTRKFNVGFNPVIGISLGGCF